MRQRTNIVERLTMEATLSPVIPTGADDSRSESSAEWRDLLFMRECCYGAYLSMFFLVFLNASHAMACTLVPGNFHQVTVLRGRVVGKSLGSLGFRWLRQSFSVSDATLTLYEYRFADNNADLTRTNPAKEIAVVTVSSDGKFDFGSVPKGHYSIGVSVKNSNRMGGLFYVEVTDKVKATDKITLDVSPINPDCTGGNEFIEKKL